MRGSTKILRVEKEHRLVVRAQPRLAIAEHSRAFRPQPIPRFDDVVDLVSRCGAFRPPGALEKGLYRRGRAERLEQLDLGVWQLDKDDGDAMRRQRAWFGDASAEGLPVDRARRRDIRNGDRDMVELANHGWKLPLTLALSPQAGRGNCRLLPRPAGGERVGVRGPSHDIGD